MTAATHRPEDPAAVHSAALSAFLSGPAIAAVDSLPAKPAYVPAHAEGGPMNGSAASADPENIRRRRWGAGADVASSSPRAPATPGDAPATPSPSEVSWWQKTSWFKEGAADVAPVLADPTGADAGRGGIADASSDGTCRNRFTGPGQRDPLRPATAGSVSLNAEPVEDPGELYGGANAYARASGGGVYVPVGGAMVHSRLSIQPRSRPRPMAGSSTDGGKNIFPRRCADAFEASLRGGAQAPERVACAVASAAARVKYDFDFEKGVWAVRDTGAVVDARDAATEAATEVATDASKPASRTTERDATPATEASQSWTCARAAATRGARMHRFAAGHDAALAAAAAKRHAREACVAAATLKRAAAQVPLPPLGKKERRFMRAHRSDAAADADADAAQHAASTEAERWRMLRLRESGDVVFFDAPDVSEALVQAWLSGETPWPEIRVMELSREARAAGGVPRGAPGPLAPAALAAAAAEELRRVAEEDAEARRAEEAASASASSEAPSSVARRPPGSTATPQQASIIERLVDATGASRKALETAAVGGKPESGDGDASASGRDVDSLKASLRENIMQKHEFKARATAAEARVAALEAALAAAGIEAP